MGFADKLKKLDAHRLQQSVKATVQSNGPGAFFPMNRLWSLA